MTHLTAHFTIEELRCKCGCARMDIPEEHVRALETLRLLANFPLPIGSGYRCPEHNARVSGTGRDGPHTKGAFDILVAGEQAVRLVRLAIAQGWTGIGIKQKGPIESRFIHVDRLPDIPGQPRPRIWSY